MKPLEPARSEPHPRLLVSVRSAIEARAALDGGAALIDVKEPSNGPLGRAADTTIAAVVAAVSGQCPVSAALGELIDDAGGVLPVGLAYVKWGLAGYGHDPAWRQMLDARRRLAPAVVSVAYADWECARAPSIDAVFAAAAASPGSVLLIDTCCKEPAPGTGRCPTLLDWLGPDDVCALCERCRAAGIRIALAGSLGAAEVRALAGAAPDWFAVRGAACTGGRDGTVSTARVRSLLTVIEEGRRLAGRAG